MDEQPTVFIVEDEPAVRQALREVIGSSGKRVESFESAEQFIGRYRETDAGCLLLDLRLPGATGLQLLRLLRQRETRLQVIMLTAHGDVPAAVESMKLGAIDFLEKPLEPRVLLQRIDAALAKACSCQAQQAEARAARRRLSTLTPREREMLAMIVAGKSSKQIAIAMNVSPRTVANHRAHLLTKTGAQNGPELVRLAVQADHPTGAL